MNEVPMFPCQHGNIPEIIQNNRGRYRAECVECGCGKQNSSSIAPIYAEYAWARYINNTPSEEYPWPISSKKFRDVMFDSVNNFYNNMKNEKHPDQYMEQWFDMLKRWLEIGE